MTRKSEQYEHLESALLKRKAFQEVNITQLASVPLQRASKRKQTNKKKSFPLLFDL